MSSSSLYGYNGNVTVSANNLTTLYNAQPGNVVVANVADRNFTTLYTNQTSIAPTKSVTPLSIGLFPLDCSNYNTLVCVCPYQRALFSKGLALITNNTAIVLSQPLNKPM